MVKKEKFRNGDWILILHTIEPEMYLKLDESNIDYYNKVNRESIGSSPGKVGELEVKTFYEQKVKEHTEEASFANMLVEFYKYNLMGFEGNEK